MQSRLIRALIAAIVSAALAMPALASQGDATSPQGGETRARDNDESTLEAIQRYSADKRDQAISEAKSLMASLDERIERLRKRLDENWDDMSETTRERSRELLKSLEDERAALADAYDRLKEGSATAWGHVKDGFIDSYRRLRETFGDADEEI